MSHCLLWGPCQQVTALSSKARLRNEVDIALRAHQMGHTPLFYPCPILFLTNRFCQSMSFCFRLVSSVSLSPDSVKRATIALSLTFPTTSSSSDTCSLASVGRINCGLLGTSTHFTGLFSGLKPSPEHGLCSQLLLLRPYQPPYYV